MSGFSVSDVTIVTVSYNSGGILPEMLQSLPEAVSVVVVNNGGSDGATLNRLTEEFDFTLIDSNENLGFGGGCNLGISHASTKFVLLLNPDAQLQEGALEALLQAAKSHNARTALGPRILNDDGSSQFKRRSVLLPRSQWLGRGEPQHECEVPVLTGSAIFAARSLFEQLTFDENIFMYHEDDDWSLRVRDTGKLVFVPKAVVLHRAGHSSGRNACIARFKAFHLAKSRIYAMKKHRRPVPSVRTKLFALGKLISPVNLFSERQRAKNIGFFEGAFNATKYCLDPEKLAKQRFVLPLWKLQRELIRPFKQLRKVLPRVASYFFSQPYYDHFLARKIVTTSGLVEAGQKIAIYLIFPQSGVLASHLKALNYLKENGYGTIVVSNLPLSEIDRETLSSHTTLTIERPNYGYDFGGYRDGILAAYGMGKDFQRLVLLNDSSWFPLPGAQNWLAQAEALDRDFVGAASNYGHPRVSAESYLGIDWNYTDTHKNFHYCSFALMMSQNMLSSRKFKRFWKKFALTNDKTVTVRRGEIGLSTWVIRNGFSHGTTMDLSNLNKELQNLSDAQLREAVRSSIVPEAPRLANLKKSLLQGSPTREELTCFILTLVAGQGVSYTLPRYMHADRGYAFLKKSPIWLDKEASDLTLEFAQSLDGDFAQSILKEAQETRKRRVPEFNA